MTFKIAQVGEAVLQQTAEQVSVFDTDLLNFINELKTTLIEANGVGIAAPQVFDSRAILIIASKPNVRYPNAPDMPPLAMINPKVEAQSKEQNQAWEGCLSVPGLRGFISRSNWVKVSYQNQIGEQQVIELEGFVARIFLHEYDHLIGQTWLDHITSSKQVISEALWYQKCSK
ncbi:peptide deformylase [Catenovulum sp. 2E275]|uniref:peptide deformylase n=1 Tax=Catenovulum sp. 2E275 TaxID=2980497 RepID=UPI0021D3DA4D|nr:peptide deformylase [Catenovulum sp. 2E275]MCU4674889.1 peptide deformylase [Catenovulum sp. 2E275]